MGREVKTVSIEIEPFNADSYAELLPLIHKCWDECTLIKGNTCAYHGDREFKISPNYEAYQKLADEGALVLVALRDDRVMRGYCVGFLYYALHHRVLCAIGDSIYADPDYRVYSPVMIEKFENEMRRLKAEIIGWPTHIDGPIFELLKARGFVGDDIVMEKRLCA